MRPTLRQLQYIVAVADLGRFGDAARRLNVSQPSLSAQIADVEIALGGALFERGRHGAILTPLGDDIVHHARLILTHVENLKTVAQTAKGALAGRLKLGVLPSIGPYLLPSATKRLHAQFPDLRLSVREEKTIELDDHLERGLFDTIISTAADHRAGKAILLFEEDLWICVAPDDPLAASPEPVKLDQLQGRPWLTLGPGHRFSQLISELAREAGAYVSSEYEGTSLDATRQMALMGAGIAVLPSLYVRIEAQRDPDATVRRIDHARAKRRISLIWREQSPLSDTFETLADILKETAGKLLSGSYACE